MKLPFIMSKLRGLSERMDAKRYASSRERERKLVGLQFHPAAKSFNMKLPIIMRDMRELYHDPRAASSAGRYGSSVDLMNNDLANIIRMSGDVQMRKTNVKADMTDWFMQRQHPIFNSLADIVIDIAKEASPNEVELEAYDIWGAVYNRGDFSKNHDHWPHPWSFVYYVKSNGATPIIFPDCSYSLNPKTNDMILFPGIIRHGVPIHESDEERIIVSGNINIKYS